MHSYCLYPSQHVSVSLPIKIKMIKAFVLCLVVITRIIIVLLFCDICDASMALHRRYNSTSSVTIILNFDCQ